jgi:hypothetical protein
MFSPYFDAPVLATANELPDNIARYAVTILQAGSFAGRALSGLLADNLGVWRVFPAMGLLTVLVLFAFWTAPIGVAGTVMGMVSYGFTSGAWISLLSAAATATAPPHEVGMRVGMLWTVVSLPILAGPVICGREFVKGVQNAYSQCSSFSMAAASLSQVSSAGCRSSPALLSLWLPTSCASAADKMLAPKALPPHDVP